MNLIFKITKKGYHNILLTMQKCSAKYFKLDVSNKLLEKLLDWNCIEDDELELALSSFARLKSSYIKITYGFSLKMLKLSLVNSSSNEKSKELIYILENEC
jgi:hypothetical protein